LRLSGLFRTYPGRPRCSLLPSLLPPASALLIASFAFHIAPLEFAKATLGVHQFAKATLGVHQSAPHLLK
jgi:hypothetical protein